MYFGSPSQQRLQRLGEALLRLMPDDKRLCSHGRGIQILVNEPGVVDLAMDIARLTGLTALEAVPREETAGIVRQLEDAGFSTDVISALHGTVESVGLARERVASNPLPHGINVQITSPDAPYQLLRDFATVALSQGVLPPAGSVMRGLSRPGFAMVAYATNGQPVAVAGSVLHCHPAGPDARLAQWGQLATVDGYQGRGLAKTLGAMAMIHSHEVLGAKAFKTGVRARNAASERLCASLGVVDSGKDIVAVIDPETFTDGKLTS